jgi:glycogen debranching enzyme
MAPPLKSIPHFPKHKSKILFLDTSSNHPEVEAAWQWLKARFPSARRISHEQVPANGKSQIIWWHGVDETENVIRETKSVKRNLKPLQRFLKNGGRLFLSLAAVQAVVPLGLEKKPPDIAEAGEYDPQSRPPTEWLAPHRGEIRGLMGFLPHLSQPNAPISPLAHFGGGIYLWNPKAGAPYWRFGYGPGNWPQGKVWGVHRYYIGFDPEQKLAWEYEKPAVLCVGAYLYFADAQNLFRQHLEAFVEACLRHLEVKKENEPKMKRSQGAKENKEAISDKRHLLGATSYWEPIVAKIKKTAGLFDFPQWDEWLTIKWSEASPYLTAAGGRNNGFRGLHGLFLGNSHGHSPRNQRHPVFNNFFDLAGERILLMGNERGRITEIWSHPIRLCRHLSLSVKTVGGETIWENGADTKVTLRPHQIERRRKTENMAITERIWVSVEAPLACVDWELEGNGVLYLELSFEVDFRLMWPYPASALSKLEYQNAERRGPLCCSQIHFADYRRLFRAHFALAFERGGDERTRTKDGSLFQSRPIVTKVEDLSANNESCARVTFYWRLDVQGKGSSRFVVLGGEAQDQQLQNLLRNFPAQLPELYGQQVARQNHVLEKFAEIDTPDPLFNAAARWAKIKTEAFVCRVPSLGRSLLAGFANTREGWNSGRSGYAWFFGRDACWTAFAMLHYGDFASVKDVLRFLGRHQEVSGKIFHELTTSGAVHYDAADATPLYVILMWRYLSHSGDLAFVKRQWPYIEKAMVFLASTGRDGLIENAGAGHGWIEGGKLFGVHVEHYLAGCWAEALRAAGLLATALGKANPAVHWNAQHQKVRDTLESDFWNEQTGYFYHGKNADGTFDSNITALAAVPLLFGYGKPEQGIQALRRLAGKAFNADWGVRLVGDDHPFYDPQGYHDGSVWPLFTGWTALAEFRYGRWLQGLMHVKNSMRNFQHGVLGCMEEVLHGELYQPAGVCPHQAWSESMILQPIYEGLLGIKPSAHEHRMELAPYIPLQWSFLSVGPIALGARRILFYMHRDGNLLTFQFKSPPAHGKFRPPLRIDFKPIFPSTVRLQELRWNEQLLEIKPEARTNLIRWPVSFELGAEPVTITLRLAKFFTAVPPFAKVAPGERSRGWVIIDQNINGETVAIEVEGEPAAKGTLELAGWGYEPKAVTGGELIGYDGEAGMIAFEFPGLTDSTGDKEPGPQRYARHRIEITLQ